MAERGDILSAWLAHLRESQKSEKPIDAGADQRREELFTTLLGPTNAMPDGENSRMLDSPEMEAHHAVNRLARTPDGTTVVRYHFAVDAREANGFCASDAIFHQECTPLVDERTKALARETMKAIVGESGAKIEFQEVSSAEEADVAFVRSKGIIDADGKGADGYTGRAGDKNYIVDGMGASDFRQSLQTALNGFTSEKQELFRKAILREYGDRYGKDADLFTILTTERERLVIAHEIEHVLGAKHPEGISVALARQTIMGHGTPIGSTTNNPGQVLGSIDVEWYQRHFGIKDLPESTLPAPSVAQRDASRAKKQR